MPPNAKGIVETKARIRFLEDERGLICSKTRYFDCTALAGSPNTDKWAGLKVEVFFDPTVKNPNGQRGGIAVRKPE